MYGQVNANHSLVRRVICLLVSGSEDSGLYTATYQIWSRLYKQFVWFVVHGELSLYSVVCVPVQDVPPSANESTTIILHLYWHHQLCVAAVL